MFSLETINDMNAKAGRKSKNRKKPFIAKTDNDPGVFKMPSIGDHRFDGYDLIDTLFVDSSGFGADNEPALTVDQFLAKVKSGLGYSIISTGQFQVHIGIFKRKL